MASPTSPKWRDLILVLFPANPTNRLRANGVISVENPVRTAVEEGRFEELPDDYEDVD